MISQNAHVTMPLLILGFLEELKDGHKNCAPAATMNTVAMATHCHLDLAGRDSHRTRSQSPFTSAVGGWACFTGTTRSVLDFQGRVAGSGCFTLFPNLLSHSFKKPFNSYFQTHSH